MSAGPKRRAYYFSTRDLVLIAVVSAAGGVLSTYVGYLGNLMNKAVGVPFGAGQWMAGLHVFWFVFARAAVGRTGAATLAGVLKGLVEMFAGSTHGLPIVLVSLVEGLLVDAVLLPAGKRPSLGSMCLAGGVSSASNVLVFQALYFSGVSVGYVGLMTAFAFVSGAILGGYFARGVLDVVSSARVLNLDEEPEGAGRAPSFRVISTLVLAVLLAGGAVFYYTQVFEPFWTGPTCRVEGMVERSYEYRPIDFEDDSVTVTAELQGAVTYVPPTDYTGVPVASILERAHVQESAEKVRIVASDGYYAIFDLDDLADRPDVILVQDEDTLRLVAAGYEGAYWVRMVSRIVVCADD
jgi:ABC-type thiamin/hydroxymethylpyrimidine transport system permease subunit